MSYFERAQRLGARLVRDFVPAQAVQQGGHGNFDTVGPKTRDRLLADKLAEEAQELAQAQNVEEMIPRLAAVWELVMIIAAKNHLTPRDLQDTIASIQEAKGGFERGFVVRDSGPREDLLVAKTLLED